MGPTAADRMFHLHSIQKFVGIPYSKANGRLGTRTNKKTDCYSKSSSSMLIYFNVSYIHIYIQIIYMHIYIQIIYIYIYIQDAKRG